MEDMRQGLLLELIDSMHGRLAEKAYPTKKEEEPKEEVVAEKPTETEETPKDTEEPSDDELAEMMKEME